METRWIKVNEHNAKEIRRIVEKFSSIDDPLAVQGVIQRITFGIQGVLLNDRSTKLILQIEDYNKFKKLINKKDFYQEYSSHPYYKHIAHKEIDVTEVDMFCVPLSWFNEIRYPKL
ncbi:MAG: hypothetical protein ACOCQR_00015 [bacterium]